MLIYILNVKNKTNQCIIQGISISQLIGNDLDHPNVLGF